MVIWLPLSICNNIIVWQIQISGPDLVTEIQSHVSLKKGGALIFYDLVKNANASKLDGLK